jgi:hypothetical protein
MLIWFVLQCVLVPFVDPVSNASEWTSRLNYLLTSGLGLCVALFPATSGVLNGVVLYMCAVIRYYSDAPLLTIILQNLRRDLWVRLL